MGHVGDVHAEPVVAILETVQRDRVVEVAGVLAVDRHGHLGPEIGPVLEVALLDRCAEAAGLLDRVLSVSGDDAVLPQDDLGVDPRLVDAAEHFDHPSDRTARGGRPLGDLDGHHVARACVLALAGGNLHVHDQAAVERHHEAPARFVDVEPAHRIAGAALENPHDPAFGAAVGNPFYPGDDAVAVHGLIEVAAGDVDIAADVFEGPIRHDEAKAARVGGDPPDHEVHPVRQAIVMAAGLDEVTGGDELAEKALDGGALFAWNLEPLQQLAWRRRMVDLVPNQLEQLFLIKHLSHLSPGASPQTAGPGRGPVRIAAKIAAPALIFSQMRFFQPRVTWPSLLTM